MRNQRKAFQIVRLLVSDCQRKNKTAGILYARQHIVWCFESVLVLDQLKEQSIPSVSYNGRILRCTVQYWLDQLKGKPTVGHFFQKEVLIGSVKKGTNYSRSPNGRT
jgi:hypothetical protein